MLKVLHVSDNPLPDARVEKMAYLSRKKGWQTFFAGPPCKCFALGKKGFDNVYLVPWSRYARLGFLPHFQWIERRLEKIAKSVKPDVIHAHDVFSARIVQGLGYPFVFDDHELMSMEKKSDTDSGDLSDMTVGKYETWLWGGWERGLSTKAPVITVSDGITEFYRKLGANVFTVPNYPSLHELSNAHSPEQKSHCLTAVYLGNDFATYHKPYRDVRGVIDVFKELSIRLVVIGDRNLLSEGLILSRGYIHHLRLYDAMSVFHVGLLPWKKHWFHKYANPNKPYIYAHSGMVVVVTSSLENVVKAFKGRARTISNFSDLRKVLLELSEDMEAVLREGKENKAYALKNFVLEHYENELMEAYKNAA